MKGFSTTLLALILTIISCAIIVWLLKMAGEHPIIAAYCLLIALVLGLVRAIFLAIKEFLEGSSKKKDDNEDSN